MQNIPFVDVRQNGLRQLVDQYPDHTRLLIRASQSSFGLISNIASYIALPLADCISKKWLIKNKNPYLDEINYYADTLNIMGVHALNICFEWGCTSAVYAKENGPTLIRVLDWIFPKLGENMIVAHQQGHAGDFYNITWPGVSGVFQAMAPGRFSASLNQAPMRRHRLTYLGDWIKNRKNIFQQNGLPPAHLLRKVFEEAENFSQAQEWLCRTPIALPVIFILSGIHDGEGCVIERIENDFSLTAIENNPVCAANQFETRLNATGHGWRSRPINSAGRLQQAKTISLASIDENFEWFKSPIANPHTRMAMISCAKTGKMSVFGTNGTEIVTHIFSITSNNFQI